MTPALRLKLIMVQSVDGHITVGDGTDIYRWTSVADSEHFFAQIRQARAIIMGRRTYEAARSKIKLTPQTLRLVMTQQLAQFAAEAVPGQLEFTAAAAGEIAQRLTAAGYTEALLVGGSECNTLFLEAGLVTDLWITVEPLIFGSGQKLTQALSQAVSLQLKSTQTLNAQGTLLLKYTV